MNVTGPRPPAPEIAATILADLPEWFGLPEANAEYVEAAGRMTTYLAHDDDGAPIGILLLNQHFPQTVEIHLMAVLRDHHRCGVGQALVAAAETEAVAAGVRLFEVKTLAASHPDPGYAKTRRFYEALGFLPVEVTDLWGDANPCLIMIKPL
ncbi:MAG: GNAT family N-acetyltransferase [Propionibacteriaceae bacterium]|jgi:GNAT superfamily N-acetyltransferase|nr:GNAT family N-acetyltransferase [Propionibacteriaceae bacterium]